MDRNTLTWPVWDVKDADVKSWDAFYGMLKMLMFQA